MPSLPWHDSILVFSCVTSVFGLCWFGRSQIESPSEAEATQETLIRLSFVYWIVYCCAHWSEQMCVESGQEIACSLRILTLLSYILTFCCLLSLPLHLIEQRRRQTN